MTIWIPAAVFVLAGAIGFRVWYRSRRARRLAARRRVEKPNSHYSSVAVRNQEDVERWSRINVLRLHPLNRDEVQRLLDRVDEEGVDALSSRDRLFLDNMTIPRMG